MDPIRRLIQNRCEILIEPAQGGKNGQQGLGRCRFDDQPVSLLAHDSVLTGEFELPRNPHSPVSPILKDLRQHPFLISYSFPIILLSPPHLLSIYISFTSFILSKNETC